MATNPPQQDQIGFWNAPLNNYGGSKYEQLIENLRAFLAAFASSRPDVALMERTTLALTELTEELERHHIEECDQVYARRRDLIGRGQVTLPAVEFYNISSSSLQAKVKFDRFYLGRNGVVHGGAILYVFDEVVGRLAHVGNLPFARTAYLRTDFRRPTFINTEMVINAEIRRCIGRKRYLHLKMHDGDRLCAEAEALMIQLLAGQA